VTIALNTGRKEERMCSVCKRRWMHHEVTLGASLKHWMAERHNALCGAPCIGGGARPIPRSERAPGVTSGIAHAHRKDGCGTAGCPGGELTPDADPQGLDAVQEKIARAMGALENVHDE
jgi:hypothetical protein